MKNTLTRKELIDAKYAFSCKDWVNNIQDILNSTNENEILIQDEYLDLIKEEATWEQILFCKALNLDLKMNLPVEAKEWILEKLKACEVIKNDEFITYYDLNGDSLFVLDSETKEFLFDYYKIKKVLKNKYFLKNNEFYELMSSILEKNFNLYGYTPE